MSRSRKSGSSMYAPVSRTPHGSRDQKPRYVPDPIDLSGLTNATTQDHETAFPHQQYSLSSDIPYYQAQGNFPDVQSRSNSHFSPPDADSSLSHGNYFGASTLDPFGQPSSSTSPICRSNSTQELTGVSPYQLCSAAQMDLVSNPAMNSYDYSTGSPGSSSYTSFEAAQSPYQQYAETTFMDPSMATSGYAGVIAPTTSTMNPEMYSFFSNLNMSSQAVEANYGQQNHTLTGLYQQMPPTPPESDPGSPNFHHPCPPYSSQLNDGSNGNLGINGQSYNMSHSHYNVSRSTGSLSGQGSSR